MPKAAFPDLVMPQIYVGTAYPGYSPADIEKLITRPIEKQINAYKVDMSLQYDDSNLYKIQIVENTPLKGTNDYFDLAGAIYRKTTNDGLPSKGLYFTSIGDGSWSWRLEDIRGTRSHHYGPGPIDPTTMGPWAQNSKNL